MASHYHAIVWIDHREAKVFHFNATEVDYMILHPHNPTRHIHYKANAIGSGDAPPDQEFFELVTEAIADAKAILITGPASAKSELAAHVARRHPDIARCVVGVETIDHPSDGALIAVARLYFKAEDRLGPQI
jgi:stalled ribosome rescue protein Dom34